LVSAPRVWLNIKHIIPSNLFSIKYAAASSCKHRGAVSVEKDKHDRFRIVFVSLCLAATLHLIPNPLARQLSTASWDG